MNSYKEFPIQVKESISELSAKYNFLLVEQEKDYSLRFTNTTWDILFYCDYGAVEVSIINLTDGYKYRLSSILKKWYPESYYNKNMSKHGWGSLQTVKFKIESLKFILPTIDKKYNDKKLELIENREWSTLLYVFANKKGSKLLKNKHSLASNDWIEQASIEFKNHRNKKTIWNILKRNKN